MLPVKAIDHVVFNVQDVEVSANWYQRVLGMVRSDTRGRMSVAFGQNKINLRPADASQDSWFTGRMPCPGSQDLCFLTDVSPDAVVEHFRRCGVELERGPVTKSGALGPICSVYVRDPDGNLIEVSSYE